MPVSGQYFYIIRLICTAKFTSNCSSTNSHTYFDFRLQKINKINEYVQMNKSVNHTIIIQSTANLLQATASLAERCAV